MTNKKKSTEKETFDPEKNKEVEKGPLKSDSNNQYGDKHDKGRRVVGKKKPNKDDK